jgi:hypothetical protein
MPPMTPYDLMQMSIKTTLATLEVQRIAMARLWSMGMWWMPRAVPEPKPMPKGRGRAKA